ncbi:MAG TPA: ThiF family adenylyltransferase [Patescibacteria group bacterium]|nr:ThiF family adenylyltransferase [Patescibacteria group bacterium]
MDSLNRSRQFDLFRPEQALSSVTLIGAGGVGSAIGMLLAKMGVPELSVFDFDMVEGHNLPSQLYRREDVGRSKVEALAEIAKSFADGQVVARAERYADQPLSGLVISAVDSMDVRLSIWERLRWNPEVALYVDTRMGGNLAVIHCVRPCDPDDVKRYEQHLYPSSEASDVPCTARAIAYNTFGVASMVGALVRRWWLHGEVPKSLQMDFDNLVFT